MSERAAHNSHESRFTKMGANNSRRLWLFRVLAIGVGVSMLAVVEGLCVFFDWGRPGELPDPFVGFQEIRPLFVMNDTGTHYEISKSRRGFFAAESFPARKGQNTFRVFCLGGSTVQGRPYSIPTSFTTWLELGLNAGDNRREWNVVNCGGISYASYRLVPILDECLQHSPDLIIVCTGHNEFLEARSYDHLKHASKWITVPVKTLSHLRTFSLMRSAWLSFQSDSPGETSQTPSQLKPEVDALLDYNRGIQAYHRDDQWRNHVVQHFEFNLRRMVRRCRDAKVPLLLLMPPSNLQNSPPFKSQHTDGMSADQLEQWNELLQSARALYKTDLERACTLLEKAAALNHRHAGTHYELAKCYELCWRKSHNSQCRKLAIQAYRRAREEDVCPLRMIAPLENAIRKIAVETQTPLIDIHALLEQQTDDGILGDDFLVDHVHPSPIRGHQLIADAIATFMKQRNWFQPTSGWRRRRKTAYQAHLKSLDPLYFPRGQRTLKALQAWSQGRAEGPPIESHETKMNGSR
ncbi:MAG: tetratricopeptide repeat protein [Planctomycetaceae bacterium]